LNKHLRKMRLEVLLAFILFLQIFISCSPPPFAQATGTPEVFVGIDMAYGDSVAQAKRQIDIVCAYTNLFVIGCKGITYNATSLNEVCQYTAYKGLNFIVYRDTLLQNATWAEMAKQKWGDHFLGYYAYDEIGGWQIDMHEWRMVLDAKDFSDAAYSFVTMEKYYVNRFAKFRNTTQFNLYTSDYALYWFDYKAGYDIIFTEFGWNISRQLNVALCRGAANMHGKEWGAIITWTYKQPPYLEPGEKLYEDLVLAYDNGAKYIILFDSNEGWTQSVLKEEHLDALKRFWTYMKENPRQTTPDSEKVAYVLQKDYGYGFRGPNDKIWGFWEADNLTNKICNDIGNLFTQHDKKLDIIYDDGLLPNETYGYSRLIYWNDSIPSQSPSPISSTTTTSAPAENPNQQNEYLPIIAIGAVVSVVAVPTYLIKKRQHIPPSHNLATYRITL